MVDLKLAAQQSNWRRKGFLEKVFSKAEQGIISTSKDPNVSVWLLWSMKEAAYKAHQRQHDLPRKLNWQAQQCEIQQNEQGRASGIVRIHEATYFTTSEITSEYIYTSAENAKTKALKNVILKASSSEAKELLTQEVSRHFSINRHRILLQKDMAGKPFFSSKNSFYFNRFSLSGHGRYSAYNLSLINCETSVKQS